jgi:hypothetical protein
MNLWNGCLFLRSFPTGLLLLGTLVLFPTLAQRLVGQDENEANGQALVGLKGIVIQVGLFGEVAGSGLTQDQLQTAAELELRRADVPAYRVTDTMALRRSPHDPGVLAVLIKLSCDQDHVCMYLITAELGEYVLLARPPGIRVFALTWEARPGIGAATLENVRRPVQDELRDMIDRFANAYLAANRKH